MPSVFQGLSPQTVRRACVAHEVRFQLTLATKFSLLIKEQRRGSKILSREYLQITRAAGEVDQHSMPLFWEFFAKE